MKTNDNQIDKLFDLEDAIAKADLGLLLQTFAENVDLASPLPSSVCISVSKFLTNLFILIFRKMERQHYIERF